MTEQSDRERLTALEAGMRHFRELMDTRYQQTTERFAELKDHNRVQDREQTQLVTELKAEIKGIKEELWRALKWIVTLLAGTMLSVVLKTLGLI